MGTAKAAHPFFIPSEGSARGPNARIYVIFTNTLGTRAAVVAAARLAHGLDLPVCLLAPRIVPYPLPLESPPVSVEFTENALYNLVRDLCANVAVQILLCRDPETALADALGPEALVVVGTGSRWWRFMHRNFARHLRADGRHLVLIN